MGNQSKSRTFECYFCAQQFRSHVQLEVHMNFHTRERPYFCQDCDLTWPFRQALYRHRLSAHRGVQYKCSKCHRLFPTYERFCKHRKNIHKARLARNGTHSITAERIRKELVPLKKKHRPLPVLEVCSPPQIPKLSLPPVRRSTIIDNSKPRANPFPQRISKRRATFPPVGLQNLASATSSPPIIPKVAIQKPVGADNMLPKKPLRKKQSMNLDQHECIFCGKVCDGYSKLESHTASHTRERVYFCKESGCDSTWATPDALYRHNQIIHRGIKYRCSACLRLFNSYDGFRKHRRDHHDGKSKMVDGKHTIRGEIVKIVPESDGFQKRKVGRPRKIHLKTYDCLFCNIEFREHRQLEMHLNGHTGEKPFACTVCDTWFASRFRLYKHWRINGHRNVIQEKADVKEKEKLEKEDVKADEKLENGNVKKGEQLEKDDVKADEKLEKEDVKEDEQLGKKDVKEDEQLENESLNMEADDKADIVVDSTEEASDTDEDPLINDKTLLYDVAKWIDSIQGKEDSQENEKGMVAGNNEILQTNGETSFKNVTFQNTG